MEEMLYMKNFNGSKSKIIDIVHGDAASGCLKAAKINNLN